MDRVVLKKEVYFSLFTSGMAVPNESVEFFAYFDGKYLQSGESKSICIIFNKRPYNVYVHNNDLNERNRARHPKDTIQIRYTEKNDFAQALQATFQNSYMYLKSKRDILKKEGSNKIPKLPDDLKEYLVIYGTEKEDVFIADAILNSDVLALKDRLKPYQEQQIESILDTDFDGKDPTAGFKEYPSIAKVRKLDRSISNSLKQLYGFRCQICGELIGDQYGVHTCESHHIDYFSISWNNDMSNQLIVCPNHHRIIHAANPIFNRRRLQYEYKNGFVEGLKLNKHLDVS